MSIQLTPDQLAFLHAEVVRPLSQAGYTVSCFGSRARGDAQPYSDVDLLIAGPGKPRQLLSEISEQLVESDFPFKVDLVLASDLATSYRESVMADCIPL